MTKAGERIINALRDAKDFADGDESKATVHYMLPPKYNWADFQYSGYIHGLAGVGFWKHLPTGIEVTHEWENVPQKISGKAQGLAMLIEEIEKV